MAEQTFRSPGFFEQEIDLSGRQVTPLGTPAGIIGVSQRGPAFVPITVGSFADFESKFGGLHPDMAGPYAVNEFLKHRRSLTFVRVLGAGDNRTSAEITTTLTKGTVKNAGFVLSASANGIGSVQFLGGRHTLAAAEFAAYPQFADNSSFPRKQSEGPRSDVSLIRGVLFTTTGSNFQLVHMSASLGGVKALNKTRLKLYSKVGGDSATVGSGSFSEEKFFKLALLSNTPGAQRDVNVVAHDDTKTTGIREFTCTFDPSDANYIGKVLNTDPLKFQEEEHLLYADFPVEHNVAALKGPTRMVALGAAGAKANRHRRLRTVFLASGSAKGGDTSQKYRTSAGFEWKEAFGRFDTRFTTPKTTRFISQPFGDVEHNLFHFETIDDGTFANARYKVSVANLRASQDPANEYGTFEVQLRAFGDTDTNQRIIERYPACNLNPKSPDYIAKKIGDMKVIYDFDQESDSERRLVVTGRFPNVSARIRVVMTEDVEKQRVPQKCLPFGFRGLPALQTSDTLTDRHDVFLSSSDGNTAFGIATNIMHVSGAAHVSDPAHRVLEVANSLNYSITSSIVPPVPMRFKVTKGAAPSTLSGLLGNPGAEELVDGRYYWGIKTTRIPTDVEVPGSSGILNVNGSDQPNRIIENLTKFLGIAKAGVVVTGSAADQFNSNKFSLSKVVFAQRGTLSQVPAQFTGSANEHMRDACYVRNGVLTTDGTYKILARDSKSGGDFASRYSFATLIASGATVFNRFTEFAKFTNVFYGGFDGVNILDADQRFFRDRALSSETGGKAQQVPNAKLGGGLPLFNGANQSGHGLRNNYVSSIRTAIDIMTDPLSSRVNILAIPGARDKKVTNHALERTRAYQKAIYIMDSLVYDEDGNRLYDDSKKKVDVRETSEQFEGRRIDNNYGATFFPDVFINDNTNNQIVKVPSSVAALGAFAFNDREKKPWFAPAGFNRAGLNFVTAVDTRLNSSDRDTLYDARINPIATFPRAGFVIFGQKTLQMAKSALDRINVRRLMLEIKRLISQIAQDLLFEPNTPQTRARFITSATRILALIQAGAGVEQFSVIMDETNNTEDDVNQNRLNGRIVVVPTRAVEFISIDFIITNNGVDFV